MRGMIRVAVGVSSLAAVALNGTPAEAACSRVSATGFGIAKEMAMEMAKMNLELAVSASGQKARGRVHYKCTGPMLLAECKASRRACA